VFAALLTRVSCWPTQLRCTNYAGHLDLSTLAQIKLNIPYCHRVVIISCSNIPISRSIHHAIRHQPMPQSSRTCSMQPGLTAYIIEFNYTPRLKKTSKIIFVITTSNFHQIWQFFGTKMANFLELYEVHSFPTSPNLCQCTTVLNADVPTCHISLWA